MAMGIQAEMSPLQQFGREAVSALAQWKSDRKPDMEVSEEVREKWQGAVEQSGAFQDVHDGLLMMAQLAVLAGDYGLKDEVVSQKMATLGAIIGKVHALEHEEVLDIDTKKEWLNAIEDMLVTIPSDVSPDAPHGINY